MDEKIIAELKIVGAGQMTEYGRDSIAEWLRKQADNLVTDGDHYANVMRAKYHAVEGE